jgi:hypothetical protein
MLLLALLYFDSAAKWAPQELTSFSILASFFSGIALAYIGSG